MVKLLAIIKLIFTGQTKLSSSYNIQLLPFTFVTEDCSPYCWKEKELNVQTRGGVRKHDVQDEEHCKSLCSEDLLCDGADWNVTNSSCWLIFKHTRTTDVVYHWEIVRDLQTSCSKSKLKIEK